MPLTKVVLVFVLSIVILGGCSSGDPITPNVLCDVEKYQPHMIGNWWVYERYNEGSSTLDGYDSIVVVADTRVDSRSVYNIERYTNGALQSTIEATVFDDQLLEIIPGMFNNFMQPANCVCPKARGAVLICSSTLPGVQGSVTADSLPVILESGGVGMAVTRYRWSTSGNLSTGDLQDMSNVVLQSPPAGTTKVRTVVFNVLDSIVIVEPATATFDDGRKFQHAESRVTRTYLFGVGMLRETVVSTVNETASKSIRTSYMRNLVRYGTR